MNNLPVHPEWAVRCPHCQASPGTRCTSRARGRKLAIPSHDARITTWVRATACCPVCQVEPGIDCHENGRPLLVGAVHPRRQTEAEETAA